jgi:hypothetical protein
MLDQGYLLYQAERVRTRAEQQAADARLGQRAAALAQVFRSIARPVRAVRRQPATGLPACRATLPGGNAG